MWRWWRGRGRADRFEIYIQVTLYANVVLVPVVTGAAAVAGKDLSPRAAVLLPVVTVHVALCVLLLRAGIAAYLGRRPRPTRLMVAGATTTVASFAGAAGSDVEVLLMAVTLYAIALATVVRPRTVLLTAGAAGGAAAYVFGVARHANDPVEPVVLLAAILIVLVPACRVTLWTLGMVRELEHARRAEAALAVAEERLRFARDLHDVLGSSLSVVAVKAELAARLAGMGRPEAAGEMHEVRRIAQESLAEMRAVVNGYRSADLGTELAGARALLASAGIACRVDAAPPLPPAVQGALGWVVREGTTNVLRHSQAQECVITVRSGDGTAVLTMENDGAPPGGEPAPPGNGLTGLTERIAALDGAVAAGHRAPDRFRLEATVPAAGPAAHR